MKRNLSTNLSTIVTTILIAIVGVALIAFSRPSSDSIQSRRRLFLMPPKDIKHFTLGYSENVADAMWIRVIQDFEVCEQLKSDTLLLGSDQSAGPILHTDTCKRGWVYHMIDTVTELAPRFKIAYTAGALMLSTIVYDPEGAAAIFEKGLAQFPTDWHLQYYAANHFMSVLNDKDKAAKLLVEAGKNGAPSWVFALAGRLYTKAGQAMLAKSVLQEALNGHENEKWAPRLRMQLERAEEELRKAQSEQ